MRFRLRVLCVSALKSGLNQTQVGKLTRYTSEPARPDRLGCGSRAARVVRALTIQAGARDTQR